MRGHRRCRSPRTRPALSRQRRMTASRVDPRAWACPATRQPAQPAGERPRPEAPQGSGPARRRPSPGDAGAPATTRQAMRRSRPAQRPRRPARARRTARRSSAASTAETLPSRALRPGELPAGEKIPSTIPGLVRKPRATPSAEAGPAPRRRPPRGARGHPQGAAEPPDIAATAGLASARARRKHQATHARRPDRPESRNGGALWRRRRTSAAHPPRARLCRARPRRRRQGPRRRPGERLRARLIGRGNRNPSCPNDPAALAADQAVREALWITRDARKRLWITVPHARVAMATSAAHAPRPPVRQPPQMQEWTPWLTPRSRRPATATTTS